MLGPDNAAADRQALLKRRGNALARRHAREAERLQRVGDSRVIGRQQAAGDERQSWMGNRLGGAVEVLQRQRQTGGDIGVLQARFAVGGALEPERPQLGRKRLFVAPELA